MVATSSSETPRKAKRATIGKRSKEDVDMSNGTCTPRWLADLLPPRDFDPCSNPRSHIKSNYAYSLENGQNGLELAWVGAGFMNWPFSDPMPFATKAVCEMESGNTRDLIVLCKLDPSTQWWKKIARPISGSFGARSRWTLDLWMPWSRIQYDEHPNLIERRRQERIAKAIEQGATPEETAKITGDSTANFVSVLLHHRQVTTLPWAGFGTFADRWALA